MQQGMDIKCASTQTLQIAEDTGQHQCSSQYTGLGPKQPGF